MTLDTKNKLFNEAVETFKSYGLSVYVPENLFESNFRYGYITDNTDILYFEINELVGLVYSIPCVPSHDTGSGLRTDEQSLDKDTVFRLLRTKYGTPYANFKQMASMEAKFFKLKKL